MSQCFIIQPFDKGKYDSRCNDVFKPAIIAAGLTPYRVDEDPAVVVPVVDIEKGIRDALICFADITTDNPNVWYELGYAFACKKEVVMVCGKERTGKFPFDIQHRSIITYENDSKGDFEKLEGAITEKLKAYLQKQSTVQHMLETPIAEQEGLKGHEIAVLVIILGESVGAVESMPMYRLKEEMNKAGYNDLATGVGVMSLIRKGMIETTRLSDFNGEEYFTCILLPKGQEWMLQNQENFDFRIPKKQESEQITLDSLPF